MMQAEDYPMVSVVVTAYNHADYIAQCLEGILMQQVGFEYELLIGEDESNDGTREICQDFAERYPERIRLFLRRREDVIYINGKPTGRYNFVETLNAARGKYVALCDGDDYWTDDRKLQKQVDFMEQQPDYAICHHGGQMYFERDQQFIPLPDKPKQAGIERLVQDNFIITCSCLFRNHLFERFPDWIYQAPVADYCLHILNARHGQIGYLPDDMCVYRMHSGGIWSQRNAGEQAERMLQLATFLRREVLPPSLYPAVDTNIYLQHYRAAYGNPSGKRYGAHFRYCLQQAGLSLRRWIRVLNLLFVKVGLVRLEKGRFVINLPNRQYSSSNG